MRIKPAKAAPTALALVVGLALWAGCGDAQQGSGREEEPPGTTVSAPTPVPPGTQQEQASSPRDAQGGRAPTERYEGLGAGEPAEFENGLVVTLEGASLVPLPPPQLGAEDPVVAVYFGVENANPEDAGSTTRSFNVTSALWQALDQDGRYLQKVYLPEGTLDVGGLPNPSPEDYPYLGWQGQLMPGQKRQGTVLFAAPPSAKEMRVTFTQPVMSPPFAVWELGAFPELARGAPS